LQAIVDEIYKITGKDAEDTQNAEGENLFEKREKKQCGPCKGTGMHPPESPNKKTCTFCKGKGTN
jgi:DnaJ-class molecular chaperone